MISNSGVTAIPTRADCGVGTGSKGPQHSKLLFCNELVDVRFYHVQASPKEFHAVSSSEMEPSSERRLEQSPLLVCQNYQRSKRRRLPILGPWRSERTTKSRNLLAHPSRRFAEYCLDTFVRVTLSKPGYRKI